MRCQYQGGRSASRSRITSAKFELTLTTRCQYQGVHLPADLGVDLHNLISSWPQDVSTGGIDHLASRSRVDLPNLNSSWPWDVSTRGVDLSSRSRGRSAKFEIILTTDVMYQGVDLGRSRGRSAKFELILTTRCQYWGIGSASRSRGRSAKFELILTMRCQYQRGVDLGVVLQIWTHLDHEMSVLGGIFSRSRGRSAKFELILTTRCQYWG